MITFIAPTKNMKPRTYDLPMTQPEFCAEAECLAELIKTYNDEAIMNIMNVNAKLALQTQAYFQKLRFDLSGTPALFTYSGLVFHSMHTDTWEKEAVQFAQAHLRIISGLYGCLRPLDSIYPYRLEMQAKGLSQRIDNLYSFWSDALMRSLRQDNDDQVYINLASKEYSQAITPYLNKNERMITVDFQVIKSGVRKTITTYAKTARGNMTEYIMKHRINTPEQLKCFSVDQWQYMSEESNETRFLFVKEIA